MKACAWTSLVGAGLSALLLGGSGLFGCSAGGGKDGDGSGAASSTGSTSSSGGAGLGSGSGPTIGTGAGPVIGAGGGSSGGTGSTAEVCEEGGLDFVPKVPTVMLMVDRSGTMFIDQGNPWGSLRDGVLPVIEQLSKDVRFGFLAVTGEAGMCPLLDEVPPAADNYAPIAAKYKQLKAPAKGESPGMLGLKRASEILKADTTPGDKYVLFVTDGEQDYCGDGNQLCPADSMVYWLQTLKKAGIGTFIFGLPLKSGGAAVAARYESTLQAFANAGAGLDAVAVKEAGQTDVDVFNQCYYGGDPNAAGWKLEYAAAGYTLEDKRTLGVYAPSSGAAKVFKPDPSDQSALAEQFRAVLAGVKSCSFDLGGGIKVITTMLDQAHVLVEGQEVPLDPTNGWGMSSPTQLELHGTACENWRKPDSLKIEWNFPCKIREPA